MSINQYFRAGTGTIIYKEDGQILLLERANRPDVWQLQQGGMDEGESVEETLWRELKEETNLDKNDIEEYQKFPTWLQYEYPEHIRKDLRDPNVLGQIHCWYYLKLKPDIDIDISVAEHPEFSNSKWGTFEQLLNESDALKKAVYQELADYFIKTILPKN